MTKKEFLEVQKIYGYQSLTAEELERVFVTLGVKDGARLFYLMLRSFNIAARVANAAWGFYKDWQAKGSFANTESIEEALHDYSPDNFGVPAGCREYAAQCFEQFYNQAAAAQTKEEIEELIFVWAKKLREGA